MLAEDCFFEVVVLVVVAWGLDLLLHGQDDFCRQLADGEGKHLLLIVRFRFAQVGQFHLGLTHVKLQLWLAGDPLGKPDLVEVGHSVGVLLLGLVAVVGTDFRQLRWCAGR